MPSSVFEVPSGSINGTNRVFYVSADYRPGTPRVWQNGLLLRRLGTDGWSEVGGRKLQLNLAPRVGDVIQVYYIPVL